jgi:uncharacterized lipoprotein YehR (DUF1307 family)
MAKTPKNTKYFTMGRGGYFFDPPESVFINAFNKNLTNKQLADKFFASETAIEKHIRGLKEKGVISDIKKIRPDDLARYKKGIKKLKNWSKNPTLENWAKYFGTTSAEGKAPDVGRQIRAYFTGDKILKPASKEILDYLKVKESVPNNAQSVLKTFTTDFFKTNRTKFGALDASASNKLKSSFDKVIAINKEFKKNPAIDLNTLTKNLYKTKFTKGDDATKLRLATTTSDDVAKYLQALNGARKVPKGMSSQWSPPTGEKLKGIVSYIGSQTDGFRFREGTLRDYKFSIRDSLLNLAPDTTKTLRRQLAGTPGVIDEVVGLSSTFKNAPGYTEFMQLIPGDINKKKAVIDNKFRVVLENAMKGEFDGVKDFNKESKAFAKKFKIDTPLLNPGGDPTKDILYFDQMSDAAKKNVLNLADKGKGFSVSTTTLPVGAMGEKLKAVKQNPDLYQKLIDAVDSAPQVCRKILNYQTGGISQTCAAAIQEDPVAAANKLKNLDAQSGPVAKVKNAATNFLQRPFVKGAGKFGALAAVGAAGAGAVKTFMNDDPTTYLSNENQQKNMLIDMVTGSLDDTPVEEAPIGDAYLPTLGAVTVAGTAATAPSTIEAARSKRFGKKPSGITKTALKTVGRGLTAAATPLGLLATEPLYLAEQIQEGDSLGEIATNPFNYLGPAFAGQATDFVTKGLKSPGLAKAMRLGISPGALKTVSRRFGLPGLALSLGISGYETFDDYRNKRGFFSEE